jgi:hypothetical protein
MTQRVRSKPSLPKIVGISGLVLPFLFVGVKTLSCQRNQSGQAICQVAMSRGSGLIPGQPVELGQVSEAIVSSKIIVGKRGSRHTRYTLEIRGTKKIEIFQTTDNELEIRKNVSAINQFLQSSAQSSLLIQKDDRLAWLIHGTLPFSMILIPWFFFRGRSQTSATPPAVSPTAPRAQDVQKTVLLKGKKKTFYAVEGYTPPQERLAEVNEIERSLAELGFKSLGQFAMFSSVSYAYAQEHGNIYVAFTIPVIARHKIPVNFYTVFANGGSLTTSSFAYLLEGRHDIKRKKIFRIARPDQKVPELYSYHCHRVIELMTEQGSPASVAASLRGLATAMDDLMAQQLSDPLGYVMLSIEVLQMLYLSCKKARRVQEESS